MMKIRGVYPWCAIVVAMMFFTGCRANTPPTAFYTLSAVSAPPAKAASGEAKGLSISIGPVSFPDFLIRPQIVTRSGANRLVMSEFHRWGGSLDRDFTRVMVENLSRLLPAAHVAPASWSSRFDPTYRIAFDVIRFEGQPGKAVLLDATWMITSGTASAKPLFIKHTVIRKPVSGNGYDPLVAAYNQAIAELSTAVAERISAMSETTGK